MNAKKRKLASLFSGSHAPAWEQIRTLQRHETLSRWGILAAGAVTTAFPRRSVGTSYKPATPGTPRSYPTTAAVLVSGFTASTAQPRQLRGKIDTIESSLHVYLALVTGVYDGDTITLDIDFGLNVWLRGERVRLARINAPEVRGSERVEGIAARDWLREHLLNKRVMLRTLKDRKGKYGHYLAKIWLDDKT